MKLQQPRSFQGQKPLLYSMIPSVVSPADEVTDNTKLRKSEAMTFRWAEKLCAAKDDDQSQELEVIWEISVAPAREA